MSAADVLIGIAVARALAAATRAGRTTAPASPMPDTPAAAERTGQ
jgi:hypothetical protein